MDEIIIKGAREHNLKNIDLNIPKNNMVVITGVSGSGKSSLAFDTIYSEGQRRYVESLSAYARQFIGQMTKPDVDSIDGLSPAISIEQKSTNQNPRSTVGTVTEIYDYMRLLFAHTGKPHCHKCGEPVLKQSVQEIVDSVIEGNNEKDKLIVMAPVIRDKKGEHKNLFLNLQKKGYVRARVNGEILYIEEDISLDKNKKHNIEVVIDRIILKKDDKEFLERFTEAVEMATNLSEGNVVININEKDYLFSENFACLNCEISLPEISPRLFSFNAPYGACPHCNGIGMKLEVDENKLVIDEDKSINDGAIYIPGASTKKGWSWSHFVSMAEAYDISLDIPYKDISSKKKDIILHGTKGEKFNMEYIGLDFNYTGQKDYEGIIKNLERRYYETNSDSMKEEIESKYMIETKCKACNGKKLKKEVLSVTVNDKSIIDITEMNINCAIEFFKNIKLSEKDAKIAKEILKEIIERLSFLVNVGLDYLNLARLTKTLSGGESQRIRLATQIGSGLTGVIYVLDEPSIGLHQRDNQKLIKALKKLKELGNTLIIVEHDEETMEESDYIIDIGPGAGEHGGEIVAIGTPDDIKNNPNSLTGRYLNKDIKIESKKETRIWNKKITLRNAKGNNLKNITVDIPLGVFTTITGVSGSGKSTLINQTLFPALFNKLNKGKMYPLEYKEITGLEELEKVIDINQSPIGRTPRSNTATYTKIFDDIRDIFSETKDSKIRGFSKSRFSFNVKGGRCEACGGAGIIKIEMNFLPDVYVKCEVCKGKRYNRETLDVYYKDKNIHDVLEMSVEAAYEFFKNIPTLERKLSVLMDVGLDYIKLGQPATTLSGGEAQRIKLASELSKYSRGKTIYILDEPTTGLHFEDVRKLIDVLERLVDKGNTVVVIEHNLDVIKSSDYIIDIGPEGGEKGGKIMATGTPLEVSKNKKSHTGLFLDKIFSKK
ncbi:MAG: excinuclease ABC subunit UvrA [Fusobacteria bacterium]|nr:excinuclease ABC subunit UvrA [Fusobacteriota bacterium]